MSRIPEGKNASVLEPLTAQAVRTRSARGRNKVLAVLDILEAMWHNEARPPVLGHGEPLDGLILTVLSQNTNDHNRDLAFSRLRERFPQRGLPAGPPRGLLEGPNKELPPGPRWEAVVDAGAQELEDTIRPAGLAPTKARRILTILGTVRQDFGAYSIAPLKDRGRDAAREYLTALPGVGAKTAACVLLFDMELPAFPVDTHVSRVCRRIGLAPGRASAEDISRLLEREVPPSRYLGGHVNMIEQGRAVCKARKPTCGACPLMGLCKAGGAGGGL